VLEVEEMMVAIELGRLSMAVTTAFCASDARE
jgi:hypothetical protein